MVWLSSVTNEFLLRGNLHTSESVLLAVEGLVLQERQAREVTGPVG